jgi:hypothetical protein
MKRKIKKFADGGRTVPPRIGDPNSGVASNEKYPAFEKRDYAKEKDVMVDKLDMEDEMPNAPEINISDIPLPRTIKLAKGGRTKSSGLHMSNADHVKKNYAVGGFMHHSDHAKKLCGGGYMKGKK